MQQVMEVELTASDLIELFPFDRFDPDLVVALRVGLAVAAVARRRRVRKPSVVCVSYAVFAAAATPTTRRWASAAPSTVRGGTRSVWLVALPSR